MNKKLFFPLILMTAAFFSWNACSDSDDNVNITETEDKKASDYEMTAEQIDDYAVENFISHVCETEVDTVAWKLKSWKLRYGKVLHPETPYVRYVRFESQQAARKEFLSMICMEAAVDSFSVTGEITVKMGRHGWVKYIPGAYNGEWARIEVNLNELPDCQEIVFCKPEAWSENFDACGVDFGTLFKKGDVYYICVQTPENTSVGYLMGFDTWTINGTYSDHKYRDRNCYDEWWWNLPGGSKVIDGLRAFLYKYPDGTRDGTSENIIRYISKHQGGHWANEANCGDYPLYNFLYSDGKLKGRKPYFKTGDDHAYIDEHDPPFVSGQWHWIRTPYTVLEPSHVYWSKIAYECDEIDPNKHNGSNTHTCNVEQGKNWGVAWCCFQFGAEWIWKVGEWYSFQKPFIIEFHSGDGGPNSDIEVFARRHGLTIVNGDFD